MLTVMNFEVLTEILDEEGDHLKFLTLDYCLFLAPDADESLGVEAGKVLAWFRSRMEREKALHEAQNGFFDGED